MFVLSSHYQKSVVLVELHCITLRELHHINGFMLHYVKNSLMLQEFCYIGGVSFFYRIIIHYIKSTTV